MTSVTDVLHHGIGEISDWAEEHRSTDSLRKALADRGCHIYGAGGFGREVAAAVQARGYRLNGFIDTFVGGGEIVAGSPCHRPDEISPGQAAESVLIIAINNFKTPIEDVVAWARALPFADIVYVPELPDVLGTHLGHYWQAPRRLIRDSASEISRLYGMLGDQRSREILAALALSLIHI